MLNDSIEENQLEEQSEISQEVLLNDSAEGNQQEEENKVS